MEEVDSIIIHFLRQLNINIDIDIKNLCDLSVETIVESVAKCLVTINQSLKVPTKLPAGVSHRIEVAAQIASSCKDLGYKNDVGYQTFLYCNETELRQVFMFLIERLPNEGNKSNISTTANRKSALWQSISHKITEELNSMWVPPCCTSNIQHRIGDFVYPPADWQAPDKIMSTEEEMVKKIYKINHRKKSLLSKASQETDDTPIAHRDLISKSLKELKEVTLVLSQKLHSLESERNVLEAESSRAQRSYERVAAEFKNVENILESVGISDVETDGNAFNILQKVKTSINALHVKSEDLNSKNLSLKVEIDKLKNYMALSESERSRCKKILIDLKEHAKLMKDEQEKNEVIKTQLKNNYDRLKGGSKRSIYTKRIMEIIANVDKQNLEIQKILEDTRQLQKEINNLEGQLDRCFSIADETLFKDAKKDDQAKKAYKLLALLHSECNTIVTLVNDMGTMARDLVDLEDNIKAETAKRTEDVLQKIQLDLIRMQEETLNVV